MYNTQLIESFMVYTDKTYSPELNDAIIMHNNTVTSFAQGITMSAIINLLIKKNIITEDEFFAEVDEQVGSNNIKHHIDAIAYNRDTILKCIEEEHAYMENLKEMHDDIMNREPTPIDISDSGFNQNDLIPEEIKNLGILN